MYASFFGWGAALPSLHSFDGARHCLACRRLPPVLPQARPCLAYCDGFMDGLLCILRTAKKKQIAYAHVHPHPFL